MLVRPLTFDARELKSRVDFVALAGRFTRLRRSGRQFVGLCPLHIERHPSFFVDSRRWYCFGCCRGGDVFAFVIAATGCTFQRALEIVHAFSSGDFSGVAAESEPRSGERFRGGVGASPGRAVFARPLHIASKTEPRAAHSFSPANRWPSVEDCAAERAAEEARGGLVPSTCTQRITFSGSGAHGDD